MRPVPPEPEWFPEMRSTGEPTGFVTDGLGTYRCTECDYVTVKRRGLHLHFDHKHRGGYGSHRERELQAKLDAIRALLDP